MDDVLELLSGTAPEYAGGYTNHAPMAAEALCHLGLPHEAFKWAESAYALIAGNLLGSRYSIFDPYFKGYSSGLYLE